MEKQISNLNIYGKLIYALDKNGDLVTVDEVEGQSACECICPYCKKPLTAKKGYIREHHFSHLPNQTCNYHNKVSALQFALKRLLAGISITPKSSETIVVNKIIDDCKHGSLSYRDYVIETNYGLMNIFFLLKKDDTMSKVIHARNKETKRDSIIIDISELYKAPSATEEQIYKFMQLNEYKKQLVSYKEEKEMELEPATGRPLRRPLTDYQILSNQPNNRRTLLEWGKELNPNKSYSFKHDMGGVFIIQDPLGQYNKNGHIIAYRKTGDNQYRDLDMTESANIPCWKLIKEENF